MAVCSVLDNSRTTTSIAQLQAAKPAVSSAIFCECEFRMLIVRGDLQRPIGASTQPATRLYSGYSTKVDENENMQGSHSESGSALQKKKKKKVGFKNNKS
jgi:hypothetical protein